MTRTLLSLGVIVFTIALVASGTTAFFGDSESSTGNTFSAGEIDLLIDNESYYNGNVCADVNDDPEIEEWQWQGDADYPVPGTPCTTSFLPSNLDGLLFFDFNDVKPDDEGEDTISIHVQNDAWVCMDLTLTSDDDRSSNEPELETGDDEEDALDFFDGELASGIQFFWWADDGDNVFEEGENQITDGVVSLASLENTFPVALADSNGNVWDDSNDPIPANETVYIAKAWCFGELTLDAVPGDGGVNPSVDPGVNCDGELLGNQYQTDGATLDIEFSSLQARGNGEFLCTETDPEAGSITIDKIIQFSSQAITMNIANFNLFVDDGVNGPIQLIDQVQMNNLPPGIYTVSENYVGPHDISFDAQFSGDCTDDGQTGTIVLGANEDAQCQLINVVTVNQAAQT